MKKGEEKYQQLFLNSPAVKILVDPQTGCIVEANGAADTFYGYTAGELRGLSIFNLCAGDPAVIRERLGGITEPGGDCFPVRQRLKNGETRDVEVYAGLIEVTGKKLIGAVIFDVTSRLRSEEELPVSGKRTVSGPGDLPESGRAEKMLQFTCDLQLKNHFFNGLISGQAPPDEEAIALKWGIDLGLPFFCCLIGIEGSTANAKDSRDTFDLQLLKNSIIDLLSHCPDCVLWDNQDYIGVLCRAGGASGAGGAGHPAVVQMGERISRYNQDLLFIMGVSDARCGPGSLGKCYREARSAVLSARCRGTGGGIFYYRDIGLYQLLTALSSKELNMEFVQKNIGPLIDYDREKGSSLLPTLEVILQSASLKEAAGSMLLHHKTIIFRKKRIERILGVSIDRFETKLALALAIKMYKLNIFVNK